MSQTAYEELLDEYQDISILNSIRGVLSWDIETKKMPAMGLKNRSKQYSLLSKLTHQFWNSKKVGSLLDTIQQDSLQSRVEKRNVELIQRKYQVNTKIPLDLVTKLASQANKTNEIWKKAKAKTDFSIVKDDMEKLIKLNKEHAEKLAEIKGMSNPFDAAIDERDEGLTSKAIDTYFNEAKAFLIPFIKKQTARFEDMDIISSKITPTREEQVVMAHEIAKAFRYPTPYQDPESARGSIDEVEHPLTISCGPDDVRITVKFGQYIRVIDATNHELGHGLHILNKNPEWRYQPVNDFGFPSLGECISRYTENKIGKAYEYYIYFLPVFNEITGFKFNNVDLDAFYNCVTRVQPGTSRMDADEVTYGMHIIIRYEIEREIYNDITVSELPQLWNQKYEEYLGVEVPNDSMGIMQDLHWFSRWFAYFHGYFMGDLMGSQFHAYMEKDILSWRQDLAAGDLNSILNWHINNIYSKGALYPSLELVEHVTGESLKVKYFKDYLESKYQE